jgi:hypothetical protein
MAPSKFNIVYASGLTIQDSSLLTTLSVLYDGIYLPHAYDLDPEARPLIRWPMKHLDDLEMLQNRYSSWKERWKPLFETGVLNVLPAAFPFQNDEPPDLQERLLAELGIQVPFFGSSAVFEGRVALAMHALFAKTKDPEFLLRKPGATDTDHLRNALAVSLVQSRLPMIRAMTPEEILRIRNETQPYREELVLYLNQLVDDVEVRLKATGGDECEAAKRTVERKIVPEFEEYLRQRNLEAEKALVGMLKHVAKGVEVAWGILMAPWNFRHYTEASKLLLDVADSSNEKKLQQASNKHRAFQFLASLETKG